MSTNHDDSYIANRYSSDSFFQHVLSRIENQLKEYNHHYTVQTTKVEELIQINVTDGVNAFPVIFEDWVIEELKKTDPYGLDKKIWKELQQVGLNHQPQYIDNIESF